MKVLSGFINFLLCLALMTVGLFVVVDRTASAGYLHQLSERTQLYRAVAEALPDQLATQMSKDSRLPAQVGRDQIQAVLVGVITPEVIRGVLYPAIDDLTAFVRGSTQTVTFRVADSFPGLGVLGVAVPLDQLPTVALDARDSQWVPILRNVQLFLQVKQILLYATLGLLLIALLLAVVRGAYVGLGVALVLSGVVNGLVAGAIWLGLPVLLPRVQLEPSVASLQPLVTRLATQLATDIRSSIGFYALGLLVAGILLISLRRFLPRYQPPAHPLDSLSNDDAPKMLDEEVPPATKPVKSVAVSPEK